MMKLLLTLLTFLFAPPQVFAAAPQGILQKISWYSDNFFSHGSCLFVAGMLLVACIIGLVNLGHKIFWLGSLIAAFIFAYYSWINGAWSALAFLG